MDERQTEAREGEQYVTASQAAVELHTSRMKICALLRDGVLPYSQDPLDRRVKLIPRSAMERLRRLHARGEDDERGGRAAGPKARAAAGTAGAQRAPRQPGAKNTTRNERHKNSRAAQTAVA